jgi:hypothetical protein
LREASSSFDFTGTRRFQILSRIGQGAVGIVYEALDRESNTRVALKTLKWFSPENILQLKSEFRAVQDLQHPNLVQLGELFEDGGNWFFTMEFVEGVHFLRYVRPGDARSHASWPAAPAVRDAGKPLRAATFDEHRLRVALAQVARGLRVLHGANKVHRDIKPSNILVTATGRVAILDFGITSDLVKIPTEEDGVVGTAAYMAPEQVLAEPLGPAADWYALGVVLYQALTGQLPFIGQQLDMMTEKLRRQPPAPHALVANVPRDLDELCMELLRIDPAARPDGAEIVQRLQGVDAIDDLIPSAQTNFFIGRGEELRSLEEAFADATKGEPVVVFVHGESGVGKSFLVRTFAERLLTRHPNTILFAGRCYERESVPYKAIDGVIDDLSNLFRSMEESEVAALLPENVGLLAQVFPVLTRIPGVATALVPEDGTINPQELRARVFAALRQLLTRIAARFRVVVLIDDLQWADADSLSLLAEVLRPPNAPSILLVATMRMVTESMQRIRIAQHGTARITGDIRNLLIEKLPPVDAQALITKLLGPSADSGHLRDEIQAIAEDANGHPLFIDELVRQRSLRGAEQGPVRLDDALWNRVTRLDPGARQLLELVCVAGIPIAQDVAAQAAALDIGQLFQRITALRAAHFVRTSGVRREDTVEAYHDRVRESVLSHLDAAARKDWHGRLALALERAPNADPESMATHWQGAGSASRAAEYALRAADEAMRALSFERAVRLYRLALDLRTDDGASRDLKMKLAEALTNAGRGAEAAETRLELAERAPPIEARDLRRRAAEQFLCSGHFDRGVALLRAALAEGSIRFPKSPIAVILSLLFFRMILWIRGLGFTPRDPSELDPADLIRIDTVRSAGAGFSMSDNVRGAYFQTRALLLALRAGDARRIARALSMEVCFQAAGGTRVRKRVDELLASLERLALSVSTPDAVALSYTAAGYTKYFRGEWEQARDWLVKAESLFRDHCVGVTFELNSVRLMLYRVLNYLGDLNALSERVPPAFREVEEHGDRYSSINLRASPLAFLGLAADAPGRVRAEVAQATAWLPKTGFLIQHYFCLVAEAQVDLYMGSGVAAYERLVASWPALERSMLLRVQAIRIAALEQRARCAVAAAVEATGAKAAPLLAAAERDVARLEHEQNASAPAAATMLRACIAGARSDRAAALRLVTAAARAFEASSMALHAAAARHHQGRLEGGDVGAEHMARAERTMTAQQVKAPAKMIAMFAPGLERVS